MVMMEKNLEEPRSAKRLRTESPRRDGTDCGENWPAAGDRIDVAVCRVGEEYQANVADYIGDNDTALKPEELLIWTPSDAVSEAQLDEFCSIAKQKYKYNQEQALGMLFWHHHNFDSALADLANFTPFPDDWSVEDKVLFEQGFSFHGKSFHRIRQLLPDKPIASLVKYYYNWKKTRLRSSLMDRQARKLVNGNSGVGNATVGEAGPGASGNSSEASSDMSDGEQDFISEERKAGCSNCGEGRPHHLQTTDKGLLCGACYQHWRKTGQLLRRAGSAARGGSCPNEQDRSNKNARKPPRGINLKQDDLYLFLDAPPAHTESLLKSMEDELLSLRAQVQNCKQHVGILKSNQLASIADYKPATPSTEPVQRISNRWTNDELLLAVQAMRKYGKDFKTIAAVVGTKTEIHVCNFFTAYRRRYNLDEILADYEADRSRASDSSKRVTSADEELRKRQEPATAMQATSNANLPPPLVRQATSSPQRLPRANAAVKPQLQQPPPPLIKAKQNNVILP